MSKKEMFVKYIEELMESAENKPEMSEEVAQYWEAFRTKEEKEKPLFTENGKLILKFLQENKERNSYRAKDIAEGMCISSRTVSGAIRKLVENGFVEKIGQDPIFYVITETGKNVDLENM